MRFLKVFLSAVFLFTFFNAQAQPITGAFGYKLGQYIPSWAEGTKRPFNIRTFKDNFFDALFISALPTSKKLYYIQAVKYSILCDSSEFAALNQVLRDKYPGPYNWDGRVSGFSYENDGKEVSLRCEDSSVVLSYIDWGLRYKVKEELQSIKQKKVKALKEKIDASMY